MATRFSAFEVLSAFDNEDCGLVEAEDRDYNGEEDHSYLPEVPSLHFESILIAMFFPVALPRNSSGGVTYINFAVIV